MTNSKIVWKAQTLFIKVLIKFYAVPNFAMVIDYRLRYFSAFIFIDGESLFDLAAVEKGSNSERFHLINYKGDSLSLLVAL